MKTSYLKAKWLAPVLGAAVVGGGLMAARTYFELQRNLRANEAFTQMVERLYQDHKVNLALKSIHEGHVADAAQTLDVLLCQNILRLNGELSSADAHTQRYVEESWRRMALTRPWIAKGEAAGSGQECTDDQAAAKRILRQALGGAQTAQTR